MNVCNCLACWLWSLNHFKRNISSSKTAKQGKIQEIYTHSLPWETRTKRKCGRKEILHNICAFSHLHVCMKRNETRRNKTIRRDETRWMHTMMHTREIPCKMREYVAACVSWAASRLSGKGRRRGRESYMKITYPVCVTCA